MKLSYNNTQAFFALVRAGLWESEVRLLPLGKINFNMIYRMAQEQSLVGLVAAGVEHLNDVKMPRELALSFVGYSLQLEQRNTAMNKFIEVLIDKMRDADIYTLLVKGQGVAQCYERPLWRTLGDVDLLLDEDNYEKAKAFLMPFSIVEERECFNEASSPEDYGNGCGVAWKDAVCVISACGRRYR